jgi:hypothetical protein
MSIGDYGFDVEAELDNDTKDTDESHEEDDVKIRLFVNKVDENREAYKNDVQVGDEIVVLNGYLIQDIDADRIRSILEESDNLRFTFKISRYMLV